MKKTRIAIIIPARYGSTRLEAKALADISGKSMVCHVYNQARKSTLASEVFVATDNNIIKEAVEKADGKVIMTSEDCKSGTDRVAEAAKDLDADIIVNVQGDEPLISPESIDQAIKPLLDDSAIQMGTAMTRLLSQDDMDNPDIVKVVVDKGGFAIYFSRSPIPHPRNVKGLQAFKHLGLYVYRKDFLLKLAEMKQTRLEKAESLEQLRVLENGYKIKVVETEHDSIGVDTAEDLEKVKELIKNG